MLWNYSATAGNAYGLVYTYSYSNPMLYGASSHQFVGANGPSLGAGTNISPVWVSGTSGFIGYGMYRTDDTNGGWLIGTSGSAVGDFGIYQNQGAGSPARRFTIAASGGGIDIPGGMSVGTVNSTGSPAYRVSGTTVIDASRNGSLTALTLTGTLTIGASIATSSSSSYDIGASSDRIRRLYAEGVTTYGSSFVSNGATLNIQSGGTLNINSGSTLNPPTGTAFSGTKTVRASGGAADCTLTFSAGIMTGGTC